MDSARMYQSIVAHSEKGLNISPPDDLLEAFLLCFKQPECVTMFGTIARSAILYQSVTLSAAPR